MDEEDLLEVGNDLPEELPPCLNSPLNLTTRPSSHGGFCDGTHGELQPFAGSSVNFCPDSGFMPIRFHSSIQVFFEADRVCLP